MRNLETATLKLGIFHPHDSLSQALIAAALQRQIEVSALQADLNSLQARPGLRCKPASLASSIEVSQAAAGLDLLFAPLSDYAAEALPPICAAFSAFAAASWRIIPRSCSARYFSLFRALR